jgi:uncharacterized protein YbgA (DUF1722 family)
MDELLSKLVTSIVGQSNSGVVSVLLIVVGYLAWIRRDERKEHREEIEKYQATMTKLQTAMDLKVGEERQTLLDVINKYHESQASVRETIIEVRAVLSTLGK